VYSAKGCDEQAKPGAAIADNTNRGNAIL